MCVTLRYVVALLTICAAVETATNDVGLCTEFTELGFRLFLLVTTFNLIQSTRQPYCCFRESAVKHSLQFAYLHTLISPFDIRTLFLNNVKTIATVLQNAAAALKHISIVGHVDGPPELVTLRLVEDLLDGDVELFAPCHRDPGIQIVELGRAEGDRLVLVSVSLLQFELLQLLLESFQLLCLLIPVDGPLDRTAPFHVLQLALARIDGFLLLADLLLQVGHTLVVRLRHRPLMVTQDGNGTIGPVIRQQLLRHGHLRVGQLGQLVLQREGRVERTEHLRREPLHEVAQMLVQYGRV